MADDMTFELYRNDNIVAGNSVRECLDRDSRYDGFSVCGYTGDSVEHVTACRHKLVRFLGVDDDSIVQCRQTHSVSVYVVESIDREMPEQPYGYDAIVTRMKDIVIGVNTADCVPLVLFDETAGVIGAVHAGWRGALAGVAVNALEKMIELGADAGNIHVFFGPSIGECCFEVGDEVAELFPEEFVRRSDGAKPHVNLAAFVEGQLVSAGVDRANIKMNGNCTRCDTARYFSARALGVESGRIFTFIMMRK